MLIAAVDHNQQVVWGIGSDKQAAYDNAIKERATKSENISWENLEYCTLDSCADLDSCGKTLYQHILIDIHLPTPQTELF